MSKKPKQEKMPQPEDRRDVYSEAAYLVSRGVRPMALVGVGLSPKESLRVLTVAEQEAGAAIAFAVHEGICWTIGYASHEWVIDLFHKVLKMDREDVTGHQILGLLLGYDAEAIAKFCERMSGRKYAKLERYMAGRDG
jgi:hypothetical protein